MNALANHQILNFNEEGKPISGRFKFLVYSIFYFLFSILFSLSILLLCHCRSFSHMFMYNIAQVSFETCIVQRWEFIKENKKVRKLENTLSSKKKR